MMRGLDDHIHRCTRCGDYGCFGTCNDERWNGPKEEDSKPQDGDSYDDARWADLMRWADEEEGGES